jgi:general nucleoside transport system permease protein
MTSIGATLTALTPILLIGLGAFVAFRGGAFDVGQVGQFELGGLAAGAIAAAVPGPGWVILLVSLAGGAALGALWSLLVSELSQRFAVELVVLSLIANYLADGVARLATKTLFQDPAQFSVIATRLAPARAWLPLLTFQTSLNAGIFIAVAAAAAVWWLVRRTTFGHRVTMFGANPVAAALSGTDPAGFRRRLLALTGSVCGLAGAVEVLGVFHQYQDGALGGTNSLAWSGLTAALVAGSSVIALLPASVLLACMTTGFAGIQLDLGIDPGLGILLQGLIILTAAFAGRRPGHDTGR